MKILLDTNVLMSAFISPKGVVAKAYVKALGDENDVIVADYNIEELRVAIARKYPKQQQNLEIFLVLLQQIVKIVSVPLKEIKVESKIRDVNDRPIIRVAIHEDVDIILTGDKDFLESGIKWPMIMSPTEFLNYDDVPPTDPLFVADDKGRVYKRRK